VGEAWTFPSPHGLPARAGLTLELSIREGWPLEELDPQVLMLLHPTLHDALTHLDPRLAAGRGPSELYLVTRGK